MYLRENLTLARRVVGTQGVGGLARLGAAWAVKELQPDFVPLMPSFLHVEVTNRCNLKCFTCVRAAGNGGDDLTIEQFKNILDQAPKVTKVNLYGIGEPLLNHDFLPMLRECRRRSIYTGFFTNLTLLRDHVVREVVDAMPDYVNLSMDGSTKAMFEKYRTGAIFEKCLEGAKRLIAEVERRQAPIELTIWFSGTSENIHELPGLVHLAKELRVRKIMVQDLFDWNVQQVTRALNGTSELEGNKEVFQVALRATAQACKETGVEVYRWASTGTNKRTCDIPWFYSFITAKGKVTPCNWNGFDGAVTFGNVLEEPLHQIWNSRDFQRFRHDLKSSERPPLCRGCVYYDRELVRIG